MLNISNSDFIFSNCEKNSETHIISIEKQQEVANSLAKFIKKTSCSNIRVRNESYPWYAKIVHKKQKTDEKISVLFSRYIFIILLVIIMVLFLITAEEVDKINYLIFFVCNVIVNYYFTSNKPNASYLLFLLVFGVNIFIGLSYATELIEKTFFFILIHMTINGLSKLIVHFLGNMWHSRNEKKMLNPLIIIESKKGEGKSTVLRLVINKLAKNSKYLGTNDTPKGLTNQINCINLNPWSLQFDNDPLYFITNSLEIWNSKNSFKKNYVPFVELNNYYKILIIGFYVFLILFVTQSQIYFNQIYVGILFILILSLPLLIYYFTVFIFSELLSSSSSGFQIIRSWGEYLLLKNQLKNFQKRDINIIIFEDIERINADNSVNISKDSIENSISIMKKIIEKYKFNIIIIYAKCPNDENNEITLSGKNLSDIVHYLKLISMDDKKQKSTLQADKIKQMAQEWKENTALDSNHVKNEFPLSIEVNVLKKDDIMQIFSEKLFCNFDLSYIQIIEVISNSPDYVNGKLDVKNYVFIFISLISIVFYTMKIFSLREIFLVIHSNSNIQTISISSFNKLYSADFIKENAKFEDKHLNNVLNDIFMWLDEIGNEEVETAFYIEKINVLHDFIKLEEKNV